MFKEIARLLIELFGGVTADTYDKDVERAKQESHRSRELREYDLEEAAIARGYAAGLEARTEVTREVVVHRHVLTEPVFEALKKSMNATTIVNSATTELMAAHQLGIQHALNIIQAGVVVPAPAS